MDYLEGLDDDEVVLDRQYSFDVFQVRLHCDELQSCII